MLSNLILFCEDVLSFCIWGILIKNVYYSKYSILSKYTWSIQRFILLVPNKHLFVRIYYFSIWGFLNKYNVEKFFGFVFLNASYKLLFSYSLWTLKRPKTYKNTELQWIWFALVVNCKWLVIEYTPQSMNLMLIGYQTCTKVLQVQFDTM